MLTAEQRVEVLLATLDEAREAWHSGSGGDGVTQMPSMYHLGSYAELEAQLARMRDHPISRPLWLNVQQRYRWGITMWTDVPVERVNRNPTYRMPPRSELRCVAEHSGSKARVMIYRWPDTVDQTQVRHGIGLLRRLMYKGDRGRIVVPPDVASIHPDHRLVSTA
jgi:hypothetical protein